MVEREGLRYNNECRVMLKNFLEYQHKKVGRIGHKYLDRYNWCRDEPSTSSDN